MKNPPKLTHLQKGQKLVIFILSHIGGISCLLLLLNFEIGVCLFCFVSALDNFVETKTYSANYETKSRTLNWTSLVWVGLDSTGLDWIGLAWIGPTRPRLDRYESESDWTRLAQTGLGWTKLIWAGLTWRKLKWTGQPRLDHSNPTLENNCFLVLDLHNVKINCTVFFLGEFVKATLLFPMQTKYKELNHKISGPTYRDPHFRKHVGNEYSGPPIAICSGHNMSASRNQCQEHDTASTHPRCQEQCWFSPL